MKFRSEQSLKDYIDSVDFYRALGDNKEMVLSMSTEPIEGMRSGRAVVYSVDWRKKVVKKPFIPYKYAKRRREY